MLFISLNSCWLTRARRRRGELHSIPALICDGIRSLRKRTFPKASTIHSTNTKCPHHLVTRRKSSSKALSLYCHKLYARLYLFKRSPAPRKNTRITHSPIRSLNSISLRSRKTKLSFVSTWGQFILGTLLLTFVNSLILGQWLLHLDITKLPLKRLNWWLLITIYHIW